VVLEALERQRAMPGEPGRAGVAAALSDLRRRGLLGEITFAADRSWHAAPLRWYRIEPVDDGLTVKSMGPQ